METDLIFVIKYVSLERCPSLDKTGIRRSIFSTADNGKVKSIKETAYVLMLKDTVIQIERALSNDRMRD